AFGVVGYVVLTAIAPGPDTRLLALAVINANLAASAVIAAARTVLSPERAGLRLLPLSDESANYAMLWVWRLAVIAVYGYFWIQAMTVLRAPGPLTAVVGRLIGLLLAAMGVILVLQNR